MNLVIAPAPQPSVAVDGGGRFPVRRIFCLGKNYSEHVVEMGGDARRDPPVFFTKPADAVVDSSSAIPFPSMTENLHFEGELVIAIDRAASHIEPDDAAGVIYGYAAGCDLTRRDLQAAAKKAGAPWDVAKAFDRSAPIGPVRRCAMALDARLRLYVNNEKRQDAAVGDMIWSIPEIISNLSRYFELKPGDLVFTGTPAGVGSLAPGDSVRVEIEGLPSLNFTMAAKA